MFRARWAYVGCGALLLVVSPGAAQEGAAASSSRTNDELIVDPELAASPLVDAPLVDAPILDAPILDAPILDPELANGQPSTPAASAPSRDASGSAEARLVLHTRFARDFRRDDWREEVWENTSIAAFDATVRRSQSLRFSLGLVARYHFAALEQNVPDARAERNELDVLPTAAYVDASLGAGVHVRAGYQPLHLGRFDVFSATNTLAVSDLREGPATLPEIPEVAQLSLLVDLDVSDWLSLRAIYVPFFTPHIISINESDYALFKNRQADVDAGIDDGLQGIVPSDQLRAFLASNLSRADRARIASSGVAALAPPPTLAFPQGAVRASAHGALGELALTVSTALEHLPAFQLSEAALQAVSGGPTSSDTPDLQPIRINYDRFAVASLDGALDVGRFSIGFELAYMLHRTLYAIGAANPGSSPYAVPIPEHSDVVQLGARVEFVQGANWLFVLEGFGSYTLALPSDPRRAWLFLERGRYLFGAGTVLGYSADFGLRLQLAAAAFNGATFVITPTISYSVVAGLEIEVGALVIEGPPPPLYSTPAVSIGGLFDTVDHVFVGVRYLL